METKVIRLDAEKPDVDAIRQAATVLAAGGLVVFPTETVYGIGCRVQPESLARLDDIKQRSSEKHYSLHIGRKQDVQRYVPRIPLRAQKLINKAWPGPVTIVFELSQADIERQSKAVGQMVFDVLYKDNSIGIRCPQNKVASMLLGSVQGPVVAPSANVGHREPATDAEQVLAQLEGRVDLLLDTGPCRLKKDSTVVKMGKAGWEVLRRGSYSADEIEAMSKINILFVCTGNTCRSPMAEGFCRKYLVEKLDCGLDALDKTGYKVVSAGIMAVAGLPASVESIAFCADKGIDISRHRSRPINIELLEESDYIFVMSQSHRDHIVAIDPQAGPKCRLLIDGHEVPDPISGSEEIYKDCGKLIEQGVLKRVSEFVL